MLPCEASAGSAAGVCHRSGLCVPAVAPSVTGNPNGTFFFDVHGLHLRLVDDRPGARPERGGFGGFGALAVAASRPAPPRRQRNPSAGTAACRRTHATGSTDSHSRGQSFRAGFALGDGEPRGPAVGPDRLVSERGSRGDAGRPTGNPRVARHANRQGRPGGSGLGCRRTGRLRPQLPRQAVADSLSSPGSSRRPFLV